MNALPLLLPRLIVSMLTFCTIEEEKSVNAKLLLGFWEVVKSNGLSVGSLMGFAKEGKFKIYIKVEGKDHKADGSYNLNGKKIGITVNWSADMVTKHTYTIKSISEENLKIEDEKGKSVELKRKK